MNSGKVRQAGCAAASEGCPGCGLQSPGLHTGSGTV